MKEKLQHLDGRYGEAYAGTSPDGVHINVVIASRGSAAYAAGVSALLSPGPGHIPFLACLGLGNVVRPATVVINKVTIDNERYERIFYGGAQLGIGQGVTDAVKEGLIGGELAGEIALLVACWVDPNASDETNVRLNAREAMRGAIRNALSPVDEAALQRQLQMYETARNNYYTGK